MKYANEEVKVSSKYQVVIPKAARRTMGLTKKTGYTLRVKSVNKNEITLEKLPTALELVGIVPKANSDPVKRTRKIRENWR